MKQIPMKRALAEQLHEGALQQLAGHVYPLHGDWAISGAQSLQIANLATVIFVKGMIR